jgi:hypothetical protein
LGKIGGDDTLAYKEMIEEAILNRKQAHIHYNSKDRIIEPAHMFTYQKSYYFVAYCYYRNEWRVFKISRIQDARILPNASIRAPITWRQVALEGIEKHKAHLVVSFIIKIEVPKLNEKKEAQSPPDWSPKKVSLKTVNQNETLPPFAPDIPSGFPKEIRLEKMEKEALCQSPLEENIYQSINRNSDVVKFLVEPFAIPYLFDDSIHYYTPDALVFYKEGKPSLVEVKLSGEIHTTVNQEKFKAAYAFAKEEGWDFCIIGIESFTSYLDYKNRQRFRWGEPLQKTKLEPFDPIFSEPEVAAAFHTSYKPKPSKEETKSYGWFWLVCIILILLMLKIIGGGLS